jgi:hypothetical protein
MDQIEFEFNEHGSFRLVVNGQSGEWTHYDGIAWSHDQKYIGLSPYWRGDEKVFAVTPVGFLLFEKIGSSERRAVK